MADGHKLDDKTYEILYNQFWNGGPQVGVKGSIFLKTQTGMWQGILNYTSLCQHIVKTYVYKHLIRMFFDEPLKKPGVISWDMVCMVLSDDSFTKTSVITPDDLDEDRLEVIDTMLCKILEL